MASGDFIVEELTNGVLTAAQRVTLRNLVDQLWAGAMADVDRVVFTRANGGIDFIVQGTREIAPGSLPNRAMAIRGRVP